MGNAIILLNILDSGLVSSVEQGCIQAQSGMNQQIANVGWLEIDEKSQNL
jgi:hypothetical protein